MTEPGQDRGGPLAGVRVVDLTAVVMGPLGMRMLADFGADVIHVEPPGGGVIRQYDPMRSEAMSAFSMSLNRNKRSVVVDLKTDEGRQVVLDLVDTADVFATTMRRAALDRLGFGPDTLRAAKPDLVYCIANGYGSTGPYSDRPAYDDVIQAASGLSSMFIRTVGEPMLIPSIMADKICGLHIAAAISASLAGRAVSGEGDLIEIPMAETMTAFNLVEHLGGKTFEPPFGGFSYSRVTTPNRRPRRTRDGYVVLLPYSAENWKAFFGFVGRPELADDERFASTRNRVVYADELYGLMDDLVAQKSTAEWIEFCDAESIPCTEVVDLEFIDEDPHFRAVGLFRNAEHPTEGPYRYVRNPIIMESGSTELRRHPPRLGADTEEVLTELGYDGDAIASIVAQAER